MRKEEFIQWLKGYLEAAKDSGLTDKQAARIMEVMDSIVESEKYDRHSPPTDEKPPYIPNFPTPTGPETPPNFPWPQVTHFSGAIAYAKK